MINQTIICPECHTSWAKQQTCENYFYALGFWELDHNLFDMHHLMVLSYYLQHPAKMSTEWLTNAKHLLVQFLEYDLTPQVARQQLQEKMNTSTRTYSIHATEASQAHYPSPVEWDMTIQDIVHDGIDHYYDNIRRWAESILYTLRASGNL